MAQRILVVDDSTTIQKVIKIAFSRFGVEVVAASSFIEALSEVSQEKVDILIIDAGLTESRGIQDFQKLANEAGAPVLLLIGSYESIDEKALQDAGFLHQIKKPFESQDIVQAVGRVLGTEFTAAAKPAPAPAPAKPAPVKVAPQPSQPEPEEPKGPEVSPFDGVDLPPIQSGGSPVDFELPPLPQNLAQAIPLSTKDERADFIPPPPPMTRGASGGFVPPASQVTHEGLPPLPKTDGIRRGQKAFQGEGEPSRPASVPIAQTPAGSYHPPPQKPVPPVPSESQWVADSELIKAKLEDFLEVEAPLVVRKAIEEYCQKHFSKMAREILTAELRRLAEEKARLLVDN